MKVRAAVVQAAPVGFDRDGTLAKLEKLVAEAADGGAQLAVFPEVFVSAYPKGIDFGTVVGRRPRKGETSSAGTSTARSRSPAQMSNGSRPRLASTRSTSSWA